MTDSENQLKVDRLVYKTAWENNVFCFRPREGLASLKARLLSAVSLIKIQLLPVDHAVLLPLDHCGYKIITSLKINMGASVSNGSDQMVKQLMSYEKLNIW